MTRKRAEKEKNEKKKTNMQLSCDPEQTDFLSYKNIVFETYQPWYPIFSIWIGLLKFWLSEHIFNHF